MNSSRVDERAEDAVSLTIEAVESVEWTQKVYTPDIREKWDRLYEKPGFKTF